jgi:hypothetical protein
MTSTKTWLLSLSAASVILMSGCARDATEPAVREDAPASDTVPGPEPSDAYGTQPDAGAPDTMSDPMSDPNSLPPSESVPPSETTEPGAAPDTQSPPQ